MISRMGIEMLFDRIIMAKPEMPGLNFNSSLTKMDRQLSNIALNVYRGFCLMVINFREYRQVHFFVSKRRPLCVPYVLRLTSSSELLCQMATSLYSLSLFRIHICIYVNIG